MHCDWFMHCACSENQVVPTFPLVQIMAFQTQRESGLTQLVRYLQHHADVDGLVAVCSVRNVPLIQLAIQCILTY